MRIIPLTLLLLCIVIGIGTVPTHAQPDELSGLDAFVQETMIKYGVPGAAVAVVKDGQVVYAKGFGVREIGTDEKVDADTIFQIASLTKTFSAAAMGTFVSEGKFGWDDNIIETMPGFALMHPYPTRNATPRDLLSHRSGPPAWGGDFYPGL